MSLRTLPILFFNLGGEMIYILDQRLKAQNVTLSKSQKVVQDIVGQMFESKCVKELFRPQRVLTMSSLRLIFGKLAHSSIMKLHESAMDKLCDLMIMSVKYQLLMCRRGEDIILVTLNHLDTIRKLVGESAEYHISLIDTAIKTLTDFYSRLTASEFIQLRGTLLSVFQDTHKRVSVFLKNGSQKTSGRFNIPVGGPIPNGFDVPGTIRYFNGQGDVKYETKFDVPFKYDLPEPPGSWALYGDRVITLGTNVFSVEKAGPAPPPAPTPVSEGAGEEKQLGGEETGESSAMTAELQLLKRLLVGIRAPASDNPDTFRLTLFNDDEEETAASSKSPRPNSNVLKINATKRDDKLQEIAKDFQPEQFASEASGNEDDLLYLMDNA